MTPTLALTRNPRLEAEADPVSRLRQAVDLFSRFAPSEPPLISIVTPTWNTKPEWFLDLALSILEQSFLEWGCIVDDHSSSSEFHSLLVELAALRNVRIEKLAERKGISGATNRALELATGEFACFVDHDDLLSRHALMECASALALGFDAVYTDSDKIDEAGRRSERFINRIGRRSSSAE